jgi:hypothetical protein
VSDLSLLVPAFKREVAIPGTFDDTFTNTLTADLVGSLADSFAQCQLDGWFSTVTLDSTTDPNHPVTTPDLSLAAQALVTITAAARFIRAQLRAQPQSNRYKAGSVEYDIGYSASAMVQDLKDIEARRTQLLAAGVAMATPLDSVYDGYYNRQAADFLSIYGSGYGFYAYEYPRLFAGLI